MSHGGGTPRDEGYFVELAACCERCRHVTFLHGKMQVEELGQFQFESDDNLVQAFCLVPASTDPIQNQSNGTVELLLACSNGELLHLCMADGTAIAQYVVVFAHRQCIHIFPIYFRFYFVETSLCFLAVALRSSLGTMDVDSARMLAEKHSKLAFKSEKWKPAFCIPILKDAYALQAGMFFFLNFWLCSWNPITLSLFIFVVTCVSTESFYFAFAGGLGRQIHCSLMPRGNFFHSVAIIPIKHPISDLKALSDFSVSSTTDGQLRWSSTLIFGGEDKLVHAWIIQWTFDIQFSTAQYRTF